MPILSYYHDFDLALANIPNHTREEVVEQRY